MPKGIPGSRGPTPHGTVRGYLYYGCRCAECHQARRDYYGERPRDEYLAEVTKGHGTQAWYAKGCRCEECRKAAATARRKYRDSHPNVTVHSANGYKNGCRCDTCREGIRLLRRAERAAARKVAA